MCGIWSYINLSNNNLNYLHLYEDFMNLKFRGPDLSSFQTIKNATIGFHRLAIMDPSFHSNQPYIIDGIDKTVIFICNGEIYNFKELISEHNLNITNNSDCMTIPKLYLKYGYDSFVKLFTNDIKGEFAFILLEFNNLQNLTNIIVGRDMIGVRPLYICMNNDKIVLSSEIKGMLKSVGSFNNSITEFIPGTLYNIHLNEFGYKYTLQNDFKYIYKIIENIPTLCNIENLLINVKNAVCNSVKRRLISDRPIAFLLSGGVDSSLVASIAQKMLGTRIKTFCCGMNDGTDLQYARIVAKHIGSDHKEVYFTPEEGLDAIKDVIKTTETWDVTTIRASVGQYLVCKYIGTQTDAKVVLVGEGPDEICSSYLFNYNAPNGIELHKAAIEYVSEIHMYDGRRADRCISRWGLEGRIPLLDPEFIEEYWKIPSEWRHPKFKGIEKWFLRQAFNNSNILPEKVLWRKKEAFSDGISGKNKSWFEIIQDHIKTLVPLNDFINSNEVSMEAYYYKMIFVELFGNNNLHILPHYWQPKWVNSSNSYVDPSARTLDLYTE